MNLKVESVLLVDNDPDDAVLIVRAFRKTGMTASPRVAENGENAMAYLLGGPPYEVRALHPLPQLIVLDLSMPLMGGLEFLKWLRGQRVLRRIPVVVLSSSKQAHDITGAYEAGANAYLVKPVSYHELIEVVRAITLFWLTYNQPPEIQPQKPPDGIQQ